MKKSQVAKETGPTCIIVKKYLAIIFLFLLFYSQSIYEYKHRVII